MSLKEHGKLKRMTLDGKNIWVSVSDTFLFTWTKFINDAHKRKISTSERFSEILDELKISKDQIFIGKVSGNIKRILKEYYNQV